MILKKIPYLVEKHESPAAPSTTVPESGHNAAFTCKSQDSPRVCLLGHVSSVDLAVASKFMVVQS